VVENAAIALKPGGEQLVLVLHGRFQLQSSAGRNHTLQARTGMHWQTLKENWQVEALGADAIMVWCAFTC
jgi:hypothetical protein